MAIISEFSVCPLPMVTRDGLQRVDLTSRIDRAAHLRLQVLRPEETVVCDVPVVLGGGRGTVDVLLQIGRAHV